VESGHAELIELVSQELRTPLHAMLGWAQMLLAHERVVNDEQLSRGLAIIVRNAKLQARVVDDLLDASSLLSGRTRLQIAPLSAEAAVRAAADACASAAQAKDVALRIEIAHEGVYVLADGERLQQVLGNLLAHALKSSPHGGAIDMRVHREDGLVCIEVEDDGPGIPPELALSALDRFRQSGQGGTAANSAPGLGLAIVRGLVELHGGAIELMRGSRGTRFAVRLPSAVRAPLESQVPPPPQPRGFESVLVGTRVAIIDGEHDARELLRAVLERAGATVEAYGSAEQLLARDRPVDALIADIRIAGDGGLDMLGTLRERGVTAPAVALTGYASPRDRLHALQAGFQMHLSRPVDGHELVVTVASVLGRFLPNAR
jgi:CheY-like chemotaxis protein